MGGAICLSPGERSVDSPEPSIFLCSFLRFWIRALPVVKALIIPLLVHGLYSFVSFYCSLLLLFFCYLCALQTVAMLNEEELREEVTMLERTLRVKLCMQKLLSRPRLSEAMGELCCMLWHMSECLTLTPLSQLSPRTCMNLCVTSAPSKHFLLSSTLIKAWCYLEELFVLLPCWCHLPVKRGFFVVCWSFMVVFWPQCIGCEGMGEKMHLTLCCYCRTTSGMCW